MKNIFFKTTAVLTCFFCFFSCGTTTMVQKYEIEPVKVGVIDTYLVKVWLYTKERNWEKLIDMAKRNAVHATVFRGFSGKGNVSGQPALAWDKPDLETTQKKFFDAFFAKGGKYMEFADVVSDGILAEDRIKLSDGYKIGIIVSVKKRTLKDYLISEGMLNAMDSGF